MLKIYNFHPRTREFIGESFAEIDQLETELNNPKYNEIESEIDVDQSEIEVNSENIKEIDDQQIDTIIENVYYYNKDLATEIPPPEVGKNEVACFFNEWIIKPDFRGETYYHTKTREPFVINFIGEIPDYLQKVEPPIPVAEIRKNLQELISNKKKEIAYGGLNIGNAIFSTAKEDQGLVLSTIMAFNSGVITEICWKCKDELGQDIFVNFTKNEFLTAFSQGIAFVNTQFYKEKAFLDELNSAELTDEFNSDFKARVEAW